MNQGKTFVFFGIAGAGKGTQIELLKKYISQSDGADFVYAGPGVGFRKLASEDSYVATKIKETINAGRLMPDFFSNSIVANILLNELTAEKNLIADGYPRTVKQASEFMSMMNFFDRSKIDVFYIEISKAESLKRNLLRGRSDDTEESINKRYDEYVANVIPAIEFMEKQNGCKFHRINGEQSIEKVHEDMIKALKI